jgi:ribulose bisphosphate carboxylase small subunit
MAKKQHPQILSPENYIRQRARNLPIFKCLVNEGWEEDGLAQLTISRRHINGNITYCSYLVDLKCLGVKDTFYDFNIPEAHFEQVVERMEQGYALVGVEYALAHNIIHAGWEFGEDIGFKAHKDFLSITRYMLEEDSDAIPFIKIDCGDVDGKPFYVQGPLEDAAAVNRILAQLEKNVGHGNYRFIMQDEIWDEEDEEDWDEVDGMIYFREYAQYSHEEKVRLFLELSQDMEEADELPEQDDEDDDDDEKDDKFVRLTALADHLYHDILPREELEQWYDKWNDESLLFTIDEDFSPSDESLNRIEEMMSRVSEHRLSEDELSYKSIFGKRDEITPFEYAQLQTLRLGYFVHEKHLAGLESLYFSIDDEFDMEEDMDEQIGMLLSAVLASRIAMLRIHLLSRKDQ